MNRLCFALIAASFGALVGCDGSPPSSRLPPDDLAERARLEARCGCQPAPESMPFPAGSPDLWCYDGCNWCACTDDGRGACTARSCPDVDAGVIDAGTP
jgi:hypothetical protein